MVSVKTTDGRIPPRAKRCGVGPDPRLFKRPRGLSDLPRLTNCRSWTASEDGLRDGGCGGTEPGAGLQRASGSPRGDRVRVPSPPTQSAFGAAGAGVAGPSAAGCARRRPRVTDCPGPWPWPGSRVPGRGSDDGGPGWGSRDGGPGRCWRRASLQHPSPGRRRPACHFPPPPSRRLFAALLVHARC